MLSVIVPVFNEAPVRRRGARGAARQGAVDRQGDHRRREQQHRWHARDRAHLSRARPGLRIIYEDSPAARAPPSARAWPRPTGSIFLIQDADFEYDLDDYDALLEPILQRRTSFVLGSRSLGLDDWKVRRYASSRLKAFLMNFAQLMFAKTFNVLYQQRTTDVNTMFKVFRTGVHRRHRLPRRRLQLRHRAGVQDRGQRLQPDGGAGELRGPRVRRGQEDQLHHRVLPLVLDALPLPLLPSPSRLRSRPIGRRGPYHAVARQGIAAVRRGSPCQNSPNSLSSCPSTTRPATSTSSSAAWSRSSRRTSRRLRDHLRGRPVHRRHRGPDPRAAATSNPAIKLLRFSRRFGQPTATLAGIEQATGDAVVVMDCRPAGPARAAGRDAGEVARRLRRRLRPASQRTGETMMKRIGRQGRLRRDQPLRRRADPAGHRRLPAARPARGRRAASSRRPTASCAGWSPSSASSRRPSSSTDRPATAGKGNYNRFARIAAHRLQRPRRLLVGAAEPQHRPRVRSPPRWPSSPASPTSVAKLAGVEFPVGNPTVVTLVLLLGGLQLICLGILGQYVGRIYEEVKQRPRYIVSQSVGFDRARRAGGRPSAAAITGGPVDG